MQKEHQSVAPSEIKYISTKSALKPSTSFYIDPCGNQYSKQALCGEGGSAKVYEFINKQGERKAVRIECCWNSKDVEMCEKAVKIYRLLNGYCEMVSINNEDGTTTFYAISDYIDGKTLQEVLKQKFQSPLEVLQLLKKVIVAIQWLNLTCKILHDDLFLSNIMINSQGKVIFIDFSKADIKQYTPSNLHWIVKGEHLLPSIISLSILPPTIKIELIALKNMIKEDEKAYPIEIFFDLIIEKLDSLIAMIPLAQPTLDNKTTPTTSSQPSSIFVHSQYSFFQNPPAGGEPTGIFWKCPVTPFIPQGW